MVATRSKLVMAVMAVMVAVTTFIGVRPAAAQVNDWRGAANGRSEHRSDRDPGRNPPGICGTPFVNDPTAYAHRYMTLASRKPIEFELGLTWRGATLPWKVEVDIDGDGRIDITYFDRDRDGKWDAAWLLNQPEGVYIWDDRNRDGKVQRDEIYLLDPFQTC